MRYPTDNSYVSSGYGWRIGINGERNWHGGADFPRPVHGNLYAISDGVVTENRWSRLGGWTLAIRFTDGVTGYYQHMKHRSALLIGQKVTEGAIVGIMGTTGEYTTGVHLHFETWRNGASFDPEPYLAQGATAGGGSTPFPPEPEPEPIPPVPDVPEEKEEDMTPRQIHYKDTNGRVYRALFVPGTGYFVRWTEAGATYANGFARSFETNDSVEVTASLFAVFEREAKALRPKDALSIDIAEA